MDQHFVEMKRVIRKRARYLDYATFEIIDAVMSNDIIQKTWEIIGYWEQAGIMF